MQRRLWLLCPVWALLGVAAGWHVAAVVWPIAQLRLRSARLAEYYAELYAKPRPNFRPESVVCYFSTAMRQGDPIGYFAVGPCATQPVSLSRELEPLITLGTDGFFRVADAEGLQSAYQKVGIISGAIEREGEMAARVRLVRVGEPWGFITLSRDQISGRWHDSSQATWLGFNSMYGVLAQHWNEIERQVPANRHPKRSIEENLTAILDNQSCDISDEIRDAVVGAVEAARNQGAMNSERIRNKAMNAISDASSKLLISRLRQFENDVGQFSIDYYAEQFKVRDEPEKVRAAILLHMKLQAKYPPRNFTPITPHRVWTALRGSAESTRDAR